MSSSSRFLAPSGQRQSVLFQLSMIHTKFTVTIVYSLVNNFVVRYSFFPFFLQLKKNAIRHLYTCLQVPVSEFCLGVYFHETMT